MNRDELFEKLMALEEKKKNSILARTFGFFEHIESDRKEDFTPERFFSMVESFVEAE
jgi:hypothetical protein